MVIILRKYLSLLLTLNKRGLHIRLFYAAHRQRFFVALTLRCSKNNVRVDTSHSQSNNVKCLLHTRCFYVVTYVEFPHLQFPGRRA